MKRGGTREREEKRNESRDEEKRSRRDKERNEESGGERGRGDAAREKGEAARGATKVAVTLYKASKPNERGPKGKKTRRSALRADAEGNGGGREGEARMDEGRRWQGCKAEAVVPRATFAFRINDVASRK